MKGLRESISSEWIFLMWMNLFRVNESISCEWIYFMWINLFYLNESFSIEWVFLIWMNLSQWNETFSFEWIFLIWMNLSHLNESIYVWRNLSLHFVNRNISYTSYLYLFAEFLSRNVIIFHATYKSTYWTNLARNILSK